ncbi:MAG: FtsH protease activity modulator HflK [Synergistaceae bacterium]|jgi:membrane protease subunit HflK|nr:FtsH protease activity modulator HflK [Synergistaceae bacterium]
MGRVIIMPDPDDPGWKGRAARFMAQRAVWLLLLLLVALVVLRNVYTVPSDSRGIVLRFGALAGTVGPGLHVKLPFADEVFVIPTEHKRSFEFGFRTEGRTGRAMENRPERSVPEEKLMLTRDNKLIEVEWVMHFHIGSAEEYMFNLPMRAEAKEKMLRDLCMATMRRIFAGVMFDDGLTSGKQKIQEEAFASLQAAFDSLKAGIYIDEVLLQETNVSAVIRSEYSSVTTAQEQAKNLIYQAEAHANKVVPEAEGRASVLVNEGEAYKFKRRSEAEGEAARLGLLREAYEANKELTLLNMWAEGMGDVWKRLSVVFVDKAGGDGVLKLLPLPTDVFYKMGEGKQ